MAADEIRGKLWKLSETIVTNRGMPHWDEDTEQRIIAATMDNVVRHFTDVAAQIIADREPEMTDDNLWTEEEIAQYKAGRVTWGEPLQCPACLGYIRSTKKPECTCVDGTP